MFKYKNIKNIKNIRYDYSTFNSWRKNHKLAGIESLRTLYQAPVSNLFTMLILGIALALPVLLYMLILNAGASLNNWQKDFYQYSIYLENSYTEQQAEAVKNNLLTWPEIGKINIITKDQGLAELEEAMGLKKGEIAGATNAPLPIVLVVTLKEKYRDLINIKTLLDKSKSIIGVYKVDADLIWLEKLASILTLLVKIVFVFLVVLGLAILLVIGNTIRLILENKQQEMTLCALLGATMAYIRRPYLYGGVFYGLFAGGIAYIVASLLFNQLYYLLDSMGYAKILNINVLNFSFEDVCTLLFCSSLLGWFGARIALYFQGKKLKDKLSEL